MADESFTVSGQTPPTKPDTFLAHAKAVFDRVDKDDDGFLSKSELSDAVHSKAYTGHDAAAVAVMFQNVGDLEELADDEYFDENDGITRADLAVFEASSAGKQVDLAGYDYALAKGPIDGADHRLFPAGLASITPNAIDQGDHNTCFFLSALASLAKSHPKAIQQMITDEGHDTYTVRFPGRDPVRVTITDGELVTASSAKNGMWVAVLEEAFRQAAQPASWGGFLGGIEWLTGHDATSYVAVKPLSLDSIREPLQEALSEKRLVIASRTWSTNGPLQSQHVYAILGFDPQTDKVEIRDPHGATHYLTVADFQDQFDLVGIEDHVPMGKSGKGFVRATLNENLPGARH
jgi:hypothetical protein